MMARGAAKYQSETLSLFEAALASMQREISTNLIVAQRGNLLQQVLAAFIVGGKPAYVAELLAMENFVMHLEDQGGSAAAVLAQSIIDASHIEGPELVAGQLHVETVEVVWGTMEKVGAKMAETMAARTPSAGDKPTYALLTVASRP